MGGILEFIEGNTDTIGVIIAVVFGVVTAAWAVFTYRKPPGPRRTVVDAEPPSVRCTARMAPRPPPHFTGREAQLARLLTLLTGPHTRTVPCVVSGVGGVGKSALARRFAFDAAQAGLFPDGVFWAFVDRQTPLGVARVFASEAGQPEAAELARTDEEAHGVIRRLFAGRRALLILDNADGHDAGVKLSNILPGHDTVAVLITTRNRALLSDVSPERVTLDCFDESEAVSHLTQILHDDQRLKVEADGVQQIAANLHRLPLAIDLAAQILSRNPSVSLLEFGAGLGLGHIHTDPPSSETVVDAVLNSTLSLIGPEATTVLECLSACSEAGFSGTTAASLIGSDDERDVSARLFGLADLSLLLTLNDRRFALHPVIRACLRTRDGAAHADRKHAAYWHGFIADHDADSIEDWQALADEWDGIRLAWDWCLADIATTGDTPSEHWSIDEERSRWGAEMGRSLRYFLDARGFWEESIKRFGQCLRIAETLGDAELVFLIRRHLAIILRKQGAYDEAEELNHANIEFARKSEDRAREGMELEQLGRVYIRQGKHLRAGVLLERALEIARSRGADGERYVGQCLNSLGVLALRRRRRTDALKNFDEAYRHYKELGDTQGVGATLAHLGDVHAELGQSETAASYYVRAIDKFKGRGKLDLEGSNHLRLGLALEALGQRREALACYVIAADAAHRLGIIGWRSRSAAAERDRLNENLPEVGAGGPDNPERAQTIVTDLVRHANESSLAESTLVRIGGSSHGVSARADVNLQRTIDRLVDLAYPVRWEPSWLDLPLDDDSEFRCQVICSDTPELRKKFRGVAPASTDPQFWVHWEPAPGQGFWIRPRRYDPILRDRLILMTPHDLVPNSRRTIISESSLLAACLFVARSNRIVWHNPPKGGASSPRSAHYQSMPVFRQERSGPTPTLPCCLLDNGSGPWDRATRTMSWILGSGDYPVRGLVAWGPLETTATVVWRIISDYDEAQACNLIIQPSPDDTGAVRVFVFPRRRKPPSHTVTLSRLKKGEEELVENNRGGEKAEWSFAGVEMGLLTQVEWGPVYDSLSSDPRKWGKTFARLLRELTLSEDDEDWHDFHRLVEEHTDGSRA